MGDIKNWCSNKENIKILFMVVMAIVLVVILKKRFGAQDVHTPDTSATRHEAGMTSHLQDSVRDYMNRIRETKPARSTKVKLHGLQPPPFLKRDLFTSVLSVYPPQQTFFSSQSETEDAGVDNLELQATMIDGKGALAIIGNEVLGIGDFVKDLEVTAIMDKKVILSKGRKKYILRINEE